MSKSGVTSIKTLVEVRTVWLALVVFLLELRSRDGFYYKPLFLRFCGIAILTCPPERLPIGMTPRSPWQCGCEP